MTNSSIYQRKRRKGGGIFLLPFLVLLFMSHMGESSSLRRSPVVIAVQKASPAVVNISTTIKERMDPFFSFGPGDFFKDFFPELFSGEYTRTSLGSGVIFNGKEGLIVTNYHVVAKATEIKVITADREEYRGEIVGSDPKSDIAILKIHPKKVLPEIKMGNSSDIMIGETVIAIGNPFGLSHTVTTGVVSALDRTVRTDEGVYRHFIQTDASINPGNSGGPLLNIDGELIGINTAIYQKAQGIGFAIPINKVRKIVKELLTVGEVELPWLGLDVQDMPADLMKYFKIKEKKTGVLINQVFLQGPGHKAGLRSGDVILRMGEMDINSTGDYKEALGEFAPGDLIPLEVFRKGKRISVRVKSMRFPIEEALDLVYQKIGIMVEDVKSYRRINLGPYKDGAVVITQVKKSSEANRAGLRTGDIIVKINEMRVRGLKEFKRAIGRYRDRSAITLFVVRTGYLYSITFPF